MNNRSIAWWLRQIGLPQYTKTLEGEYYGLEGLLNVSDGELKEAGIQDAAHRRTILAQLSKHRQNLDLLPGTRPKDAPSRHACRILIGYSSGCLESRPLIGYRTLIRCCKTPLCCVESAGHPQDQFTMADAPMPPLPLDVVRKTYLELGRDAAAAKIKKYLEDQDNIPLNIGITGESGSGKSTLVNAIRGVDNQDDDAAPTGCVETTRVATPYRHPRFDKVTVWDMPGMGTTSYPADQYLQMMGYEEFDFFIVVSDTRFTENDVKLAREIRRVGKKFYFVRSKIDHNLRDEEHSQRNFDRQETLERIRQNCTQGLQNEGFEAPQVFLISSFKLHLFDFPLLQETLERELPQHKKNVLLLSMPNVSRAIIAKKKAVLEENIKYLAGLSALVASVPIPGLSFATDMVLMVKTIIKYQASFELDQASLMKLARTSGVPLSDLKSVMKSKLGGETITRDVIIKFVASIGGAAALMAAEEGSRYIPLIGIPVAAGLSFGATYSLLSTALDALAEDAYRVFTKASGLDSSV